MIRKVGQRGDTIIEVLFAIAVLSVTIVGAYGVASRSLQAARQAQERGEALKIAEGQLETIKAITSSSSKEDDSEIFPDPDDESKIFCLQGITRVEFGGPGWSTRPDINADNLDGYPPECVDGFYHTSISATKIGDPEGDIQRYQFTVTVRWFKVGGNSKEELKLEYRSFQQS